MVLNTIFLMNFFGWNIGLFGAVFVPVNISDADGSSSTQYTFFIMMYLWQVNVPFVLYCCVVVGPSYVI